MTVPSDPVRLAIFASGSGTNFEAIVLAARDGRIPRVTPILLVCDRPDAGVLERAKKTGNSCASRRTVPVSVEGRL